MSDDKPADRQTRPSNRGPRDLIISLLVLLVPMVLVIGGYQIFGGRTQPVQVDPGPELATAAAAGIDIVQPYRLGEGWVVVSAVFRQTDDGDTLRIGYATPTGGSVQIVQSTVPAEELLPAELPEAAAPAGTIELADRSWQQYMADSGERALVELTMDQTTMVVGGAPESELHHFAAALL